MVGPLVELDSFPGEFHVFSEHGEPLFVGLVEVFLEYAVGEVGHEVGGEEDFWGFLGGEED